MGPDQPCWEGQWGAALSEGVMGGSRLRGGCQGTGLGGIWGEAGWGRSQGTIWVWVLWGHIQLWELWGGAGGVSQKVWGRDERHKRIRGIPRVLWGKS